MIVENVVLQQALLYLTTHANPHTIAPTNTHKIHRQQNWGCVRIMNTSLSPLDCTRLNQNNLNEPSHNKQMQKTLYVVSEHIFPALNTTLFHFV